MLKVEELELTRLHPWEDNPRLNDAAVEDWDFPMYAGLHR